MFHRIVAGYFDSNAITSRRELVVTRPINTEVVRRLIDEFGFPAVDGTYSVGSETLTVHRDYVDCPWLGMGVNATSVKFLLRLGEETNCRFADLGHGEVVTEDVLRRSIEDLDWTD